MSYELEKAQDRLTNIRKVQPILSALRTISLGSWQAARNRTESLQPYTQQLLDLLPLILPAVSAAGEGKRVQAPNPSEELHVALLVIGSERGLCGQYNQVLIDRLQPYLEQRAQEKRRDARIDLHILGSRMIRVLERSGFKSAWTRATSPTAMPPFQLAYDLTHAWLDAYEAYELDAVDILYNADRGAGDYAPVIVRLIPPELPDSNRQARRDPIDEESRNVVVETDPLALYVRVIAQWTAIGLYQRLLEAKMTEHMARFQLMESATQNAEELIDDLMLSVRAGRRQAITREMQELATSAGLMQDEAK